MSNYDFIDIKLHEIDTDNKTSLDVAFIIARQMGVPCRNYTMHNVVTHSIADLPYTVSLINYLCNLS